MPIVLKPGGLNFLELSGPVQACNGIALPSLRCNYRAETIVRMQTGYTCCVNINQ